MKKHYNKFLNWVSPKRRKRLLIEIIKGDEDLGLYDETFKTKEND